MLDQLSFLFEKSTPAPEPLDWIHVGSVRLPIHSRRNPRARRYLMRLRSDRSISLTIPRRGNQVEGLEFVRIRSQWIQRQLKRLEAITIPQHHWSAGTEILFRGEPVTLQLSSQNQTHTILLGSEKITIRDPHTNLRPLVQAKLQTIAKKELPAHVTELARAHDLKIGKITIRNQSTRWGSCSTRGSISLNWRLIQTPNTVRDYIILHELMHLKEMNHSPKFWALVEKVCPAYLEAERWLKVNGTKLGL